MKPSLKPLLALLLLASHLPAPASEKSPAVSEEDRAALESALGEVANKLEVAAIGMEKDAKTIENMSTAALEMAKSLYMFAEVVYNELSSIPKDQLTSEQKKELAEMEKEMAQMRKDIEQMKRGSAQKE